MTRRALPGISIVSSLLLDPALEIGGTLLDAGLRLGAGDRVDGVEGCLFGICGSGGISALALNQDKVCLRDRHLVCDRCVRGLAVTG
ncbi:hypothetical protein ACQPTN_09400 [Bradyrhizobium sp. 13971]